MYVLAVRPSIQLAGMLSLLGYMQNIQAKLVSISGFGYLSGLVENYATHKQI